MSFEAEVAALMRAATHDAGVLGRATSYHLSTGGREWRAELTAGCGRALAVSSENCARLEHDSFR